MVERAGRPRVRATGCRDNYNSPQLLSREYCVELSFRSRHVPCYIGKAYRASLVVSFGRCRALALPVAGWGSNCTRLVASSHGPELNTDKQTRDRQTRKRGVGGSEP